MADINLTLGQELAEVNEAISAVYKRKEYTTNVTYKSKDLKELRASRRELLENINTFGSNYIMVQKTEPLCETSLVSFS